MLDINKALYSSIKKHKGGSSSKVYHFTCLNCEEPIVAQKVQLKTHSGKCRKCTQKKRPYEHILNELKKTCLKTGRDFKITYEEFLVIINIKICHYCEKPLIFNPHTRDKNSKPNSRAYQLDRKNNNLGYTKENVVPCCWDCNRIKSDIYTYEEFLKISKVLKEVYAERVK